MSIGTIDNLSARVSAAYPDYRIDIVSRRRWWFVRVELRIGNVTVYVEGRGLSPSGAIESASDRLAEAGCPV